MHELAVTQGLFDLVIKEANKQKANKVCKVKIKIGDCYDYVPEIIQEYFQVIAEGTIAEEAVIEAENVPAVVYCEDCKESLVSKQWGICCPKCAGRNITLESGKEFYVENMEIE